MASDKYDDLDDLLDDEDLQNKILAQSPGSKPTSEAEKSPATSQQKPQDSNDKSPSEAVPDISKLKLNDHLSPEESDELTKTIESLMKGSGEGGHSALEALMASITQADVALSSTDGSNQAKTNKSETKKPETSNESTKPDSKLDAKSDAKPDAKPDGRPQSFEDTIAATMDRLNQSQKPSDSNEQDVMAKLLQDMQNSLGENDTDAGGMEGLLSMLLGELSSKEVLYEPLSELHKNYPDWMAKNKDKLDKKELARYEKQQSIVADIIAKFEEPDYSDLNAKSRQYITDKMVEMQESGAPPPGIVGEVAGGAFPGFPGENTPPDLPGDCATQ